MSHSIGDVPFQQKPLDQNFYNFNLDSELISFPVLFSSRPDYTVPNSPSPKVIKTLPSFKSAPYSYKNKRQLLCSTSLLVQPVVVTAVYSGIPVWELEINQVSVMRRCKDSYLNCTQLLNLANIKKRQRLKILEREIFSNLHEKVQGGYGKYQGTWVPFSVGCCFAQKYGVAKLIQPLLELDPSTVVPPKPPSKRSTPVRRSISNIFSSQKDSFKTSSSLSTSNTKKPTSPKFLTPRIQTPPRLSDESMYPIVIPTSDKEKTNTGLQRRIWIISELEKLEAKDEILPKSVILVDPGVLDLPLDFQGYTALHYCASMGRAMAAAQLIAHGAEPSRASLTGQTPLMRVVLHPFSHHRGTYNPLVRILQSTISIKDKRGRNFIHHLVLASDCQDQLAPAQSYLENLEFLLPPDTLISILNDVDLEGDTPSHLAARLGQSTLIDIMLRLGACGNILNNSGLSLSDYTSLDEDSSNTLI